MFNIKLEMKGKMIFEMVAKVQMILPSSASTFLLVGVVRHCGFADSHLLGIQDVYITFL